MKRTLNKILAMLLAAILLAAPVCAAQTGYTDVPENTWYEEAIRTVTEQGWMNGTGSGKFSPNATLTRAMLATVLWRMENCPAAAATGNFTDTVRGSWYDGGVSWCVAEGIFQGFPDGSFRPNDAITREQLALVFYRYADASPPGRQQKSASKMAAPGRLTPARGQMQRDFSRTRSARSTSALRPAARKLPIGWRILMLKHLHLL